MEKKIGKYKGAIVIGYPGEIDGSYSNIMMTDVTNEEKMNILMEKIDEKYRCKACGNWKDEHTFWQALKCSKELAKKAMRANVNKKQYLRAMKT